MALSKMEEMNKAYSVENEVIIVNREMTKLDLFVKEFLDVLKKHSDYLVVSGFVSISTGRTRGTEDIDILAQRLSKEKLSLLLEDLSKNKFWCFQGETIDEISKYIENKELGLTPSALLRGNKKLSFFPPRY
jgi:hypothetical protein